MLLAFITNGAQTRIGLQAGVAIAMTRYLKGFVAATIFNVLIGP